MPTYEYRCERCGHTLEVVQSFTDSALTTCESCDGPLRKVYAPVGIVFKGSGFYKTDSRTSSRSSTTSSSDGAGVGGEKKDGDKKDGDKKDVKKDGAVTAASPKSDATGTAGSPKPATATAKKD